MNFFIIFLWRLLRFTGHCCVAFYTSCCLLFSLSLPASLCARLQGSLNKHKMATRAWIRQQHDVCICSTYNIYTLHTLRHLPTLTHTHQHIHTHALSPYEKQTNCHADAENANKKCVRGKGRRGERDLFCWCWVNVFKIVVKFIGYENLMICKVADKRGAPPGDTSKQQKPKPSAECERILGIYSNINICLFLQPRVRVIGIAIVWLWNWWKLCWLKFSLRCWEREYILGTLPLSFAHKCLCTKFGGSKVFSVPMAKQNCIKVLLENPFFLSMGQCWNPSPIEHLCFDCIMHLTHLSTPCECIVWICVYLRFIFLLLSEISVRFRARDGIKKYLLCLDFAPHKSNASARESCCSFWAAKKDRQRVRAESSWLRYTL